MAVASAETTISPPQPITWQARKAIIQEVWRLAVPVILTNLLQSLVEVIDVFMVGRLGPIAIAAVGISSAIRFLVLVMMLSVAAGAMTMIAQAKGARDAERPTAVAIRKRWCWARNICSCSSSAPRFWCSISSSTG
jgi:Na+-driven multidrug efflux pump